MKKVVQILLVALVFVAVSSCKDNDSSSEPQVTQKYLAFPGAEGGGKFACGGAGGQVIHITSLEDNEPSKTLIKGTLRHALMQSGARTIVFDVAGIIHLKSELVIEKGSLTIAGQTAPGDGICIADGGVQIHNCSNVLVQFIRFRMGDKRQNEADALEVRGCKNVMIDHCSMSWSTDECVSVYDNENTTVQYCIIAESLRNSVHGKGRHGYGGIWGGNNASFHHNLLCHHDSRNPRFDHQLVSELQGPIDFVNNVVYNWGGNSAYGGEGRKINFVNNWYQPGPASSSQNRFFNPTTTCSEAKCKPVQSNGRFYLTGNVNPEYPDATADNWGVGVQMDKKNSVDKMSMKVDVPFEVTALSTTQTPQEAFETVLQKAGCSLQRDILDQTYIKDVRNDSYTHNGSNGSSNGLIDTQSDAGGWPQYNTAEAPKDTDNDGIPDEWEVEHGLDPLNYLDGSQRPLGAEFTNLQTYIHSIVAHLY
ncbi:MAG: pectate lyase [Paludibacteraceae bacterium]|nr:pectate lyase [Paludibacteraceae bacterium]